MATYYWTNGAGTWDSANTLHWSLVSNSSSGGDGVPTYSDDVVFSSTGAGTVTLVGTVYCQNLTMTGCTFAGTGGPSIKCGGSFLQTGGSLGSGILGGLTFTANVAGLNPITHTGTNISMNGSGRSHIFSASSENNGWILLSNWANGNPAGAIGFTQGIIDLNYKSLRAYNFNSQSSSPRLVQAGMANNASYLGIVGTLSPGTTASIIDFTNFTTSGNVRFDNGHATSFISAGTNQWIWSNTSITNCINLTESFVGMAYYGDKLSSPVTMGVRDYTNSSSSNSNYLLSCGSFTVYGNLYLNSLSASYPPNQYTSRNYIMYGDGTYTQSISIIGDTQTVANALIRNITIGDTVVQYNTYVTITNDNFITNVDTYSGLSGYLTLNSGTFDTGNNNVYLNYVTTAGSSTTKWIKIGSKPLYIRNPSGINLGAGNTVFINNSSSKIIITSNVTSNATLYSLYPTNWPTIVNGMSANANVGIYISSNSTIQDIQTANTPAVFYFDGSKIPKFTNFNLAGTGSSNMVFLRPYTGSSSFTVDQASTLKVNTNYLNIANSTALVSGLGWYVNTTSVNAGNNTGWSFLSPPAIAYGSRLYSNGVMFLPSGSSFDEITKVISSVSPTFMYSSGFDEITLQGSGVSKRETSNGNILTKGMDEITGIS
jgi:hypothetical protein